MRAWRRLLPDAGDRRAAAAFLGLTLGPIALTLLLWAVPGPVAAQLTWSFRAGFWPYSTEGAALQPDQRWFRTSPEEPLGPWGEPYFVESKNDDDSRVCSAGRDRVFELGEGDDVQGAYALVHDAVYVASSSLKSSKTDVVAFDLSGRELWRESLVLGTGRLNAIAPVPGRLYAVSNTGRVYAWVDA